MKEYVEENIKPKYKAMVKKGRKIIREVVQKMYESDLKTAYNKYVTDIKSKFKNYEADVPTHLALTDNELLEKVSEMDINININYDE
jgi:hypothetical protein